MIFKKQTMLRIAVTIAVVIALAGVVSCKNNRKSKLPDPNDKVTEFATIPSVNFLLLGVGDAAKPASADLKAVQAGKDDITCQAFSLGAQISTAHLSVKVNAQKPLLVLLNAMLPALKRLEMTDTAQDLQDKVLPEAKKSNWVFVETALFALQSEVEQNLLSTKQYELYSLLTLGEWSELTYLVAGSLPADKSKALIQPEAWQGIVQNLSLISADWIKSYPQIANSQKQVKSMQGLLGSATAVNLTPEQITQIKNTLVTLRGDYII